MWYARVLFLIKICDRAVGLRCLHCRKAARSLLSTIFFIGLGLIFFFAYDSQGGGKAPFLTTGEPRAYREAWLAIISLLAFASTRYLKMLLIILP